MRAIVLVVVVAASLGCASSSTPQAPGSWIDAKGGVATQDRCERAEALLAQLQPHRPDDAAPLRISVLATEDVTAFAWPNGAIFLTRGLMDRLDDDELLAAIAHELGHVDGTRRGQANEAEADRRGIALLEAAGIPGTTMRRMLEKLRNHASPRFAIGIGQRIAALGGDRPTVVTRR